MTKLRRGKEKGSSHSKRPVQAAAPSWVKSTGEEVENQVVELSRRGYGPSTVGSILRDQYGVPLVKQIVGKNLGQILQEKGMKPTVPEDLTDLIKRAVSVRKHLEEHPKDEHSRRGLRLVEAKIHRISKYYKREGSISQDWEYKPEEVMMMSG